MVIVPHECDRWSLCDYSPLLEGWTRSGRGVYQCVRHSHAIYCDRRSHIKDGGTIAIVPYGNSRNRKGHLMKKLILIFIVNLTFIMLYAITHTVSLDGTADFTSIQAAIDYSTHADTIKVFPGRYFENIFYNGKNVYVTSLFYYTDDRNDIYNTIIDGNQQSICVAFRNNETRDAVLNGFVVENGIGILQTNPENANYLLSYAGGGINIRDSSPSILNCIIQNNKATFGAGGGILIANAFDIMYQPFLSGNIIKNNYASWGGGGVWMNHYNNVTFDAVNKNSIFCNRASVGHDIFIRSYNRNVYFTIPLDTFTVATDDPVFAAIYCDYDMSIEHHIIDDFINHDLYVSLDGSDEVNDGLSPITPFKTISHALYWIASDPINPKTVYVAPGVYSPLNGQPFPLGMKSYVTLQGAGTEQTIFDSEHTGGFIRTNRANINYKISGISFRNTFSLELRSIPSPLDLEGMSGLEISDCSFINNRYALYTNDTNGWRNHLQNSDATATFRNLYFDNSINDVIRISTYKAIFENITITNQQIIPLSDGTLNGSPPIHLGMYISYPQIYTLSNILIYNNECYLDYEWNAPASNAISFPYRNQTVLINNATITGNTLNAMINGGPILLGDRDTNVHIYNSIIYGNSPNHIYSLNATNTVSVHNTLLQGGQSAIVNAQRTWGQGNLNTNPLFLDNNMVPFQLSDGSPAIDAGTLDIDFPDYVWPTTDILGNPRVVGGAVDMGAYEYQGLLVSFIATPTMGDIPLTVQFTDQSTGPVYSWYWYINDELLTFSREQHPSYTFTIPGLYSIRLVVNGGEREFVRQNYIEARNPDSENDVTLPVITDIAPPYPNPFRARTMFKLTVNEDGKISMNIYNIKGQKVRTLLNERKDIGIYQIIWDGKNDKGHEVASGIYTVEFKHGNKKMGTVKVSYVK